MALGDSYVNGYESFFGIAKESAWGTALTATTFLEFTSENMTKTQEGRILEALGSTGRTPLKRYLGNVMVGGSIEAPLNIHEDGICQLINNAMGGTVTSSGDATNGYNHIVSLGNMESGTSSLTLTKRVGDASNLFQFTGCRVNTFTVKGDIGTPEIMISAEVVGKDGTISTDSLTVAISAEDPLLWTGVTFEVADTLTSFDGSTNTETIQAFELTINNNLQAGDESRALGSNLLSVLPVGDARVTLKTTQRYETSTAYSRAFDETVRCVRISLDSGITIGTAGTTASIMFTLPKAYVETEMTIPELGNTGIVTHDTTWTPLQPTTGQDYISCEYNNNTASF